MSRILSLTLCLLLSACDQSPQPSTPANLVRQIHEADQAVYQVVLESQTGWLNLNRTGQAGMAVALDSGRFLTAAHVLDPDDDDPDAHRQITFISMADPEQVFHPSEVLINAHPERDIAQVLVAPALNSPRVFRIAQRFPGKGAKVTALLFSEGRGLDSYKTIEATVVGSSWNGLMFVIDGLGMSGDSGGPILNDQGELIGLISGGPGHRPNTIDFPFYYQPYPGGGFDIVPTYGPGEDSFTGHYIVCANVVQQLD